MQHTMQTVSPTFLNGDFLELSPSFIKGGGKGLFATQTIPAGTVVGQYYGDIYPKGSKPPRLPEIQDRMFETKDGTTIVPDAGCLCQYINDCINIEAVEWVSISALYEICEEHNKLDFTATQMRTVLRETLRTTDEEIMEYTHHHDLETSIPDASGSTTFPLWIHHNVDWQEKGGRVFIVTTAEVCRGEELFLDYGECYWIYTIGRNLRSRFYSQHKN